MEEYLLKSIINDIIQDALDMCKDDDTKEQRKEIIEHYTKELKRWEE